MRYLAGVLACLALAQAARAAELPACHPEGLTPEQKSLLWGYVSCVLNKAQALEPSKEATDAIATAALSACRDARTSYIATAVCADMAADDVPIVQTDDRLKAKAIEIVVEARAARAKHGR